MLNSDTKFHKLHEELSKKIYNNPEMLPSRYVFILTNMCNLRCNFCFQDKKNKENAMTCDDWINLAKQLPEYARVTLTGGEPLMFKEFERIFSFIAERFDCNLITNGLLLTKEKIDFLLSFPKFKVLSISIDDIGNKVRDVMPEQWKKLEEMMKYFIQRKGELGSECILDVKTMILDGNSKEMYEIYKYLKEELHIDTHAFQFLKGSPIQHADTMFKIEDIFKKSEAYTYKNFDEIKEELRKIKEYNLKKGISSFVHPKIASLISEEDLPNIDYINSSSHDKERYNPCIFPWSSIHINFDGEIFPCLAVSMGNIKSKSLKEIIYGKEFQEFKNLIKECGSFEACNRCGWLSPKELNSAKIHLFGATGFVGKRMLEYFSEKNAEIKSYSPPEYDLLFEESLASIYFNKEDVIIMASAITRLSENSFESMVNNLKMAENLSRLIKKNPVSQVIFLSTIDVYGINPKLPINENTSLMPDDYYANSKLASEFILKKICSENNIPLLILRMAGVYGKGDEGKSTLNKLIQSASNGKITIIGDGQDKRCFLYVEDICKIIEEGINKKVNSILNIGTKQSLSIMEIAETIKKYFPNSIIEQKADSGTNRVKDIILDTSLFKQTFSEIHLKEIREGIEEYLCINSFEKGFSITEHGEINLIKNYPQTKRNLDERAIQKTEEDKRIAKLYEKEFFDGSRKQGYGGYNYNPRFWMQVIKDMINHYPLTKESKILDLGCAKGFMLYDFTQVLSGISVKGIDISKYAIENAKPEIKEFLNVGDIRNLSSFKDKEFDLVISINTVHNLPLEECKQAVKEIERIGKNAFITVDAWKDKEGKERMLKWNLTAETLMSAEDWKNLFKEVGYTGDYYWFIP